MTILDEEQLEAETPMRRRIFKLPVDVEGVASKGEKVLLVHKTASGVEFRTKEGNVGFFKSPAAAAKRQLIPLSSLSEWKLLRYPNRKMYLSMHGYVTADKILAAYLEGKKITITEYSTKMDHTEYYLKLWMAEAMSRKLSLEKLQGLYEQVL